MSQNNSMEDILTSIRTSVEEETAKVSGGEPAGEDVLNLSDSDILGEAGTAPGDEELIDIDAFANSGEQKAASNVVAGEDVLGVNAPHVAAAPAPAAPSVPAPGGTAAEAKAAEDEFDRLLAELETPPAAGAAAPAAPTVAVDEVVAEEPDPVPAAAVAAPVAPAPKPAPVAAAPLPVSSGGRLELAAIQSVDGLQVAFPAEVLAAALRPLVKDWVSENLPAIVERLVKDEIAKISQE